MFHKWNTGKKRVGGQFASGSEGRETEKGKGEEREERNMEEGWGTGGEGSWNRAAEWVRLAPPIYGRLQYCENFRHIQH